MNRYLVDFLGWDYGYGDKDLIQYEVEAWSEEEARQKVLRDKSNIVLSEADHHERELRMEQGI